MLSTDEIEFLLDLPNEYDLVLEGKPSKSSKSNCNTSVQKIANSSLYFSFSSHNLDSSLPAQKVKNKCDLEEEDFFNSELYLKILKNSKNALKSVESERNSKSNSSGNQGNLGNHSLLEKIKVYPIIEDKSLPLTLSTDKILNTKRK
jgi:hypothetical protein